MYVVTLNHTYSGTEFTFRNFDDAMGFAGMAIESGAYVNTNGIKEPVKVTIEYREVS